MFCKSNLPQFLLFTLPSKISLNLVTFDTDLQGNPKDKICLAVEPVEIILILFLKNESHKFFRLFLLYTEIKANLY